MNFSISEKGLLFICSWEKFRALPYLDSGGLGTIGYGHKCLKGEVWPTVGIDEARALLVLGSDLQDPQRAVNTLVRATIQQPQFDALVSLCFNIGQGNFRGSTLLKELNASNMSRAADEFLLWNRVKGFEVIGLLDRRKAERVIFLTGEYVNHV